MKLTKPQYKILSALLDKNFCIEDLYRDEHVLKPTLVNKITGQAIQVIQNQTMEILVDKKYVKKYGGAEKDGFTIDLYTVHPDIKATLLLQKAMEHIEKLVSLDTDLETPKDSKIFHDAYLFLAQNKQYIKVKA